MSNDKNDKTEQKGAGSPQENDQRSLAEALYMPGMEDNEFDLPQRRARFDHAVARIRAEAPEMTEAEIEDLIEEAVEWARKTARDRASRS